MIVVLYFKLCACKSNESQSIMKVICVKICEHFKKNFCVNKENLLFTLLFLYKALKMSALYARETKETKKQCPLTLYIAFYYFNITLL